MVAASRSGSTSAVMRLSSPRASTFSSQASRSLLLGLRCRAASTGASGSFLWAASTATLISISILLNACRPGVDPASLARSAVVRHAAAMAAHVRVHPAERPLHDHPVPLRQAAAKCLLQRERRGNEPVHEGTALGAQRDHHFTAAGARPGTADQTHADQARDETRQCRCIDAGEAGEIDLALAAVVREHRQHPPHGDAQAVRRQLLGREADRQDGSDPVDQVGKIIVELELGPTHRYSVAVENLPTGVYESASPLSKSSSPGQAWLPIIVAFATIASASKI